MIHIVKIQNTLLGLLMLLASACSSDVQKKFQESIAVKADILHIDNSKDTLIFGSQVTGLYFEKNSFVLPDGSYPKGEITIQLKECYSNSDIVTQTSLILYTIHPADFWLELLCYERPSYRQHLRQTIPHKYEACRHIKEFWGLDVYPTLLP